VTPSPSASQQPPLPPAPTGDASGLRPTGRPGRPRRYEAAEEQQRLLDAGFDVIRREGYGEATVAGILAEAGMSTRSFYRHFSSKDELLHALFRRDTEQFTTAVACRVEAAPAPAAGLRVWVDEILGFGFDRPRAERAAVLGSEAAMRSLAPGEVREALNRLVLPLAEVLVAGNDRGDLTSADPAADALLISSLAWETASRIGEEPTQVAKERRRAEVLSFIGRALGTDLS
jgi:AcrR family transcriptional regulator